MMQIAGKTPIQLYHWKAHFADGTYLAQFDDFGNEILSKNICPEKYKFDNPTTGQREILPHANIFEEFEKLHGRVIKIGWYPFTKELAEKCIKKNPALRIATYDDLKQIELEVADGYYAGPPKKVNKVEYGMQETDKEIRMIPIESLVHKVCISIFPHDGRLSPVNQEWLVQYQ